MFIWFFHDLCIFSLVPTYSNNHSPLPNVIDSLQQGKTFTSQLSLGLWRSQLVLSVGNQDLLLGSLVDQSKFSCSKFGSVDVAGWDLWWSGPAGWVSYSGGATSWAS